MCNPRFDQRPDLKGTETGVLMRSERRQTGFDQRPDLKGTETENHPPLERDQSQASINDPI